MLTPTQTLLQQLYHAYRHTIDIDAKGVFFSPTCIQICQPIPSYAATSRAQIVQYLKDAEKGNVPASTSVSTTSPPEQAKKLIGRGHYTIRPLHPDEHVFSSASAINLTHEQLLQKSKKEGWVGMRVDLWGMDQDEGGMLVKVRYWWREEHVAAGEDMDWDVGGRGWRQCGHDIIYLGERDGTEGVEGGILE
jgi:hypothetical protein